MREWAAVEIPIRCSSSRSSRSSWPSAAPSLVADALLRVGVWRPGESLPDARLRLAPAARPGGDGVRIVVGDGRRGPKWAAAVVTIGLALSLVPILLRVLPPLAKDATTKER